MNHEKCVIIVGLSNLIQFVCNHIWTFWVYYFLHVHIEQQLVSVAAISNFWPNSRTMYVTVNFSCV